MKKTLFAISAIAVLLGFTACTSENEILEPQVSGKTILKAYTEETTRTALSGDDETGYKVVWSTGDAIKIGENTFTLNDGAGTTSGTFTGDELTNGTEYTAYYPVDYDGTTWPTAQTYTAGNITGSPMKVTFTYTAGGEEPSLKFKNEGGILRLNLKLKEGDAVKSVKKIVVSSTQLAEDIELNCETAVALTEEGVPFHIAVPAEAYSDLKFTIFDDGAYKCVRTLSTGNTLTVERSQITPVNLTAKTWEYLGLCFTAEEAGATINMLKDGTLAPDIQYSTDLSTWTTFTPGTSEAITLANVGDKVYFRGNNPTGFSTNYDECVYFEINNGKVAASGNVMSLVDPTCQTTTIPCEGCFYYLFYYCTGLTTAPELPATTLKADCYAGMFYYCTSLTTAPALPAETLADKCYEYMFVNCTSLTTAPELPATTLTVGCYSQMFYYCTSLTTAPELPATELKDKCYQWMFCGCSNLTTAPELPATTLANNSYEGMFYYCTKLNSVTCLATDISATDCVKDWLNDTAASGTLTCAPGMKATWAEKVNGWTVKEPTKGKAKATIGGSDVDVNWVQLWADGPKFAEYNVADKMSFEDAAKTGADYVWGANWRTPSKDELDELVKAASSAGSEKVTCVYGQVSGNWGFTFTSKEEGYTGNSVFFPATGSDFMGAENYWSSSEENDENGYKMRLFYDSEGFDGKCLKDSKSYTYLVRPVLAK